MGVEVKRSFSCWNAMVADGDQSRCRLFPLSMEVRGAAMVLKSRITSRTSIEISKAQAL